MPASTPTAYQSTATETLYVSFLRFIHLFAYCICLLSNAVTLTECGQESAADKAKRKADREIKEMAAKLSADQSIIVCDHSIPTTR